MLVAKYRGMTSGIRAELKLPGVVGCPMARISENAGVSTYSVSKSINPNVPEQVTEEFTVVGTEDLPEELSEGKITKAFEQGSESIYRFERTTGRDCPCECVEQHGYPVVDARAEDGTFYLLFHAPDQDALRSVLATIREKYPRVEVRRLIQSQDQNGENLVFFDKSLFTERQQEVLETAHQLGYFDHPKGANAGQVADELGITTATFTEHLSAAQRKLLDSILDI